MKAIIMAGGEGKRLRPITCTMPKPMVPLLNKPIIDYTMDLVSEHGLKEIVFAVHYMADKLKTHIGDGSIWNTRVTYSDPGAKLGTAGSVRAAAGEPMERILVLSGDGITDIDLNDVIKRHEASGADATIVLKQVTQPAEYGVALVNDEGMIERFIEKPEKNETFSDLANTGIYVLEPRALKLIPENLEFDFSKNLFPLMLQKGMKLFGCRTGSYWCDVGDTAQYLKAQRDMLEGKCKFRTTAKNYGGIFVEPNVSFSEKSKLFPPCYIGSGAQIAEGVCIEQYTVLGSNTAVERGASLKRSVLFENARVRAEAELRGAVVCEGAHIDERASLFENSVIGANAHIGAGVSVMPNISIWPEKQIEGGFSCRDNIVWGSSLRRISVLGSCITGYADCEITPETALRIGASFAGSFKPPAKLVCGTDGSQISVMLKYSVISGICSQGVDVLSEEAMSRSAFAYALNNLGCDGGIYITGGKNRMTALTVFEKDGQEASPETMRGLYNSFIFGEKQPFTGAELGLITGASGQKEAYGHWLVSEIESGVFKANPKTLRISASDMITDCLGRALLNLGWRVEKTAEAGRLVPSRDENILAIAVDENDTVSAAAGFDTIADEQALMTVLLTEAAEKGELQSAVLPVTFAEVYRETVKTSGIELIFAPEAKNRLRRSAYSNGLYRRFLYEPEAMVLKLCELFAKGELKKRLSALPANHIVENNIRVNSAEIGRILRAVTEGEKKEDRELIDGIRLKYDTGWVVVRPHFDGAAAFHVIAGSSDAEYARELCDIYSDKLNRLREKNHFGEQN